eukprot:g8197.t1
MQHSLKSVFTFLCGIVVLLCSSPVIAVDDQSGFLSLEISEAVHSFFEKSSVGYIVSTTERGSRPGWPQRVSRRLLNNPFVVSQCSWNEAQRSCEVDMKYALNPYNERGNTFQSILGDLLDCKRQPDESSCLNKGCTWDSHNQDCWRQNLASDHKSSPCAKTAPLFFDGLAGTASCKLNKNAKGCNSNKACYWNERRNICVFDTWYYLIGVEVLSGGALNGTSEARKSRIEVIKKEVESKIEDSEDPVDWDSILHLIIPPSQCPSGVNTAICNAANAMSGLFLTDFYCVKKYQNKTVRECDADEFCASVFNGNVYCLATSKLVRMANQVFLKEVHKSIENPFNKDFIQKTYSCYTASSNKTCSQQEDCLWDAETNGCRLSDSWVLTQIIKPQEEMKEVDAVCQYYSDMLHSTCSDANREFCVSNKDCIWSSSLNFCRLKVDVIIQSWIDHDSKMSKRVETIKQKCSKHKSQLNCV